MRVNFSGLNMGSGAGLGFCGFGTRILAGRRGADFVGLWQK